MKQQAIKLPEPKADTRSLHEILLSILQEFGPRKHEALIEQLGANKGHFSEVINGKKHWPLEWIDFIVDNYDCRSEVAAYFARRRGLRVCPPRQATPAERLRRLTYVLDQHNSIGTAILAEAAALPDDIFAEEE